MPQTSREPSPSVKRFPPEHWHALWLEKTKKACERSKIKDSTAAGFGDFIARFRTVNLVTAAIQFFYIVKHLYQNGITNLIFSSPGKSGEIETYFDSGESFGVSIHYWRSSHWPNTAGIVRDIVNGLESIISDPFLVIYGDSLLQPDFGQMVLFHNEDKSDITILSHNPVFESFLY